MAADLPPCGGDVRQDRGGREGAPAQPLSIVGAERDARRTVAAGASPASMKADLPLEGEMSGRTEGGAKKRRLNRIASPALSARSDRLLDRRRPSRSSPFRNARRAVAASALL